MEIRLEEKDLDFVIRTVVTKRSDYDNIKKIIRDKPDLINTMLDDPRLFQRIASEEEVLLKISRLADNFEHVRKPLLYIAGRYLSFQKHRWFDY